MRLTRETLLKIARETANQRARVSRRIVCIYLTGSLLEESPLLGGTTDIDLFIIHDSEPVQPREIVHLSDEISLDISHFDQAIFHQPRHLRTDPWLGPYIYSKPMVFYDSNHWFDFTQASTGAQFFLPDYVLERAGKLAQSARQAWMALELGTQKNHPQRVFEFLESLENAANALVSLTGEGRPLAERRFLLLLPHRLQPLHQPDLVSGLTSLLVADPSLLEAAWPEWQLRWKEAFTAAGSQADAPARLNPARLLYYQRGAAVLWEENPDAAVWLLMRSWTQSASRLPEDSPALASWQAACQVLGLDEQHFPERLDGLDHYLDRVEETLDSWASANGVTNTPNI